MSATFRAANSGNNGSGTGASYAVTLPTGWQAGDLILVIVGTGVTSAGFNTLSGWTLDRQDSNSGGATHTTAIYYRVMQAGDSNPTFTSTTSGKSAWATIAIKPDTANEALSINATVAPLVNTTAGTSFTPPAATATTSDCSVLLFGTRASVTGATAINVTPPTNWTEPTSGDSSTATGTTTATRQIEAECCYQQYTVNGSIAPGSATTNVSTCQNVYHYLIKTSLTGGRITEDSSTPAVATQTGTSTSITSPSFSPPRGSLLVALVAAGKSNNFGSAATVSDSVSHAWTNIDWTSNTTATGGGFVGAYWAYCSSAPGAMTVTATLPTAFGTGGGMMLDVRVLLGANPSQTGAGFGHWAYTPSTDSEIGVTMAAVGSIGYGIASDTSGNNAWTPNGQSTVLNTFADATDLIRIESYRGNAYNTAPNNLIRFGGTIGTSDNNIVVAAEIMPVLGESPTVMTQYSSFY